MKIKIFLTTFLFLFLCFAPSKGQLAEPEKKKPNTRILFIFDASQSMAGIWESDKKINIARKLLINIIDSLQYLENVQMGLRIYGHQFPVPPQVCDDSKLEVPFSKNNASRIRQELRFINPKGTTPIALSLQKGGHDFPPCEDECRNIIILITDGIEACDGDPCAVSQELQRMGITLKPFVIGIGIDEGFKETFDCIGNYYNADNEEQFKQVLEVVISQALNATTAQVNLLDVNGKPTETDVNMTFYDQYSGQVKYNYMHTINHKGVPDTLVLDHLIKYRLKINTLPPVEVKDIELHVGKHTVIAAETPQGSLVVKSNGNQIRDLKYIVRKDGDMNTLNYQEINKSERYIVGKYDLEIPTIPKMIVEDVEIKQSHTTTVEIPRPGLLTAIKTASGYGSLYVLRDNDQEWVYNFDPVAYSESIQVLPGTYRIVFRATNAKQTLYTIVRTFEVKSGSSKAVNLY